MNRDTDYDPDYLRRKQAALDAAVVAVESSAKDYAKTRPRIITGRVMSNDYLPDTFGVGAPIRGVNTIKGMR